MFMKEFEKIASNAARILEHSGLGVLQAPSWKTLADKNAPTEKKKKAGAEIGGLGLLHLGTEASHEGTGINRAIKKYAPKLAKGV
jgi:hypothetical protein